MRAALITGILLTVALAGCTKDSGDEGQYFNTDFITPGRWDVDANTDYIMAWAQNGFPEERILEWDLTALDGGPLPDGWSLDKTTPVSKVEPAGTSMRVSTQDCVYVWLDHAWTFLRLTLDPEAEGGRFEMLLHAGEFEKPVTLFVDSPEARQRTVSDPGDVVAVQYQGRYYDNKEEFDSNAGRGPDYVTAGGSETIVGFSYGLAGLPDGQTTYLAFPAGLAYGHDPEDPDCPVVGPEELVGRNLEFDVTIVNTDPEVGQQEGVES